MGQPILQGGVSCRRQMRFRGIFGLLSVSFALVALAACDTDVPQSDVPQSQPVVRGCSAEARPGLIIELRDAVTGAKVGAGSILTVREGSVLVDSGQASPEVEVPTLAAANERPGVYSVTVRTPGYRVWSAESVAVTKEDECHVRTVRLVARLQRE